ncbi:hypothetical protein M885DRAFT_572444 [Pelagophyceae sp. CCMP2097]|nr:hypothetical protein M885DRAFT_572444 [Pelagophyceae sp. CCMP2097]
MQGVVGQPGWAAQRSFFDLYAHNFVVALADPVANAAEIGRLYSEAAGVHGSALVVFPELCVCGYSLDDLLQQDCILDECLVALDSLRSETRNHAALLVVGAPLRFEGRLFNCAVVLGVVPKSYLPNFREFYEARQFVAADCAKHDAVELLGEADVPFGADLVFKCSSNSAFAVGVEVCQDVWVPVPPSTFQAWRGATVLANLSASNITIGKARYRRELVSSASAKLVAAYVYASAGRGESTNDVAWDGHAVAFEAGDFLGETKRFSDESQALHVDVDLDRLLQDRARDATWAQNAQQFDDRVRAVRQVTFNFAPPQRLVPLAFRDVPRRPYVPSDAATLAERCYECYNIQVAGLKQRMRSSGISKLVIGVSGGLDSTHALLVCCQACDALGLPRTNVLAYTMPGFATGDETKGYALELMRSLGVSAQLIDIRPACDQMLKDLDHPYSRGERCYDVTFENVQAGQRTAHLFRLANHHGAFVVGTGDLSELALGWCTYGVGDHMSHYGVNASVPKSLIQCVIQWAIDSAGDAASQMMPLDAAAVDVLRAILAVEISPELVPQHDGAALQSTEDALGPYDLHDFQLYHTTRRGLSPAKVAYLAAYAWAPADFPRDASGPARAASKPAVEGAVLKERDFSVARILECQREFLRRFFQTSQFKRTCIPNGPKVGDGGSLSPRGDWRAPSDASWAAWRRAWERTVHWARDSALELDNKYATDFAKLLLKI